MASARQFVYTPINDLGRVVFTLLLVLSVTYFVAAVSNLLEVHSWSSGEFVRTDPWDAKTWTADRFPGDELYEETATTIREVVVVVIKFVAFCTASAFFLSWQYRSYCNLLSMNIPGLKQTPGDVVTWWFVPIAWWWRPFGYMKEIWKASDPLATTDEWQKAYVPLIMHAWWATWVLHSLIVLGSSVAGLNALSAEEHMVAGLAAALGGSLGAAAALMLALIVRTVTGHQAEKFEESALSGTEKLSSSSGPS